METRRSASNGSAAEAGDASLGELVATATRELSTLMHQEIALARAEIRRDVVNAASGAGLLGGAGVAGLFAVAFGSVAAAFGLAGLGLPLGLAFLVVGVAHLLGAGLFALTGRRRLTEIGPPERTIATVKDDLQWAKHPTRAM